MGRSVNNPLAQVLGDTQLGLGVEKAEENQDKGGWLIPAIGYILYPFSTIRPAPRSKEGNEDGIE